MDTQTVLEYERNGLKTELEQAKNSIPDFKRRQFNRIREKALIYILEQSVDLTEGGLLLSEAKLPASSSWIARGSLEYLFWGCWVILSDENATQFLDRAANEIKRQMLKLLKSGYGKLKNKKTNEDMTHNFLNSKKAKTANKIEIRKCALEAGLVRIYDIYYSFMATTNHGGLYGLEKASDPKNELASLAVERHSMECINLVTRNWITSRKRTPPNVILKLWP